MTVIDTRPAALPVRVWRWALNTLTVFWCDFAPFIRREIESIFRKPT